MLFSYLDEINMHEFWLKIYQFWKAIDFTIYD